MNRTNNIFFILIKCRTWKHQVSWGQTRFISKMRILNFLSVGFINIFGRLTIRWICCEIQKEKVVLYFPKELWSFPCACAAETFFRLLNHLIGTGWGVPGWTIEDHSIVDLCYEVFNGEETLLTDKKGRRNIQGMPPLPQQHGRESSKEWSFVRHPVETMQQKDL